MAPWIESLAAPLTQGVLLLIDYGYRVLSISPERHSGTLACYYRHRMHDDPLHLPGLQDITAHVDFTAVVEAGVNAGLELLGYASQSAFLLDNGLLELAAEEQTTLTTEVQRMTLARQIKTLTLPGEMGERFQVMLWVSGMIARCKVFEPRILATGSKPQAHYIFYGTLPHYLAGSCAGADRISAGIQLGAFDPCT